MEPSVNKKQKGRSIVLARNFFAKKALAGFTQRGKEITRIEALSDAVFAFSISLLVVSLEVPQTFGELKNILLNFPPFVATVCLVLLFWYHQNRYFRHYGLNDLRVTVLNMALLLMVLFYVYPLKFLFSLLFGMVLPFNFFPKAAAQGETIVTQQEFPQLVMIYSAGYAAVWFVFFLLYTHAWSLRGRLELSAFEARDVRRQQSGSLLNIIISGLCLLFAGLGYPALGGLCFLLLAPALLVNNFYYRQKRTKKDVLSPAGKL